MSFCVGVYGLGRESHVYVVSRIVGEWFSGSEYSFQVTRGYGLNHVCLGLNERLKISVEMQTFCSG